MKFAFVKKTYTLTRYTHEVVSEVEAIDTPAAVEWFKGLGLTVGEEGGWVPKFYGYAGETWVGEERTVVPADYAARYTKK